MRGTVFPRTELMRLDGAMPSYSYRRPRPWWPLLAFPLPCNCLMRCPFLAGRPPGCLAAGTLSIAASSLAGQTRWMMTQSCTAAFETRCSAIRTAGDGVPTALFIKESSMRRLELPYSGKRANESLSETKSSTLAPFATGTAPYSAVWPWLEKLKRQCRIAAVREKNCS